MGHRNRASRFAAMRSVVGRPQVRTREALPTMRRTKEGTQILCPFCSPTHPIVPGEITVCGTILKLTAIQTVVPSRVARVEKLSCMKCHQGGGEMVRYMNGFIHLQDCTPGTNLLRTQPNYNPFAGWVFGLPKLIRNQVVKVTGYPQKVLEISPEGVETGKVVGYFFMKGNPDGIARQTSEPTAG